MYYVFDDFIITDKKLFKKQDMKSKLCSYNKIRVRNSTQKVESKSRLQTKLIVDNAGTVTNLTARITWHHRHGGDDNLTV